MYITLDEKMKHLLAIYNQNKAFGSLQRRQRRSFGEVLNMKFFGPFFSIHTIVLLLWSEKLAF